MISFISVIKRCEYSKYFKVNQTSFQTDVDNCRKEIALTFYWFFKEHPCSHSFHYYCIQYVYLRNKYTGTICRNRSNGCSLSQQLFFILRISPCRIHSTHGLYLCRYGKNGHHHACSRCALPIPATCKI